jgi:hypothetical protein
LKFDGAVLDVVHRNDLVGQAGIPYTAIITHGLSKINIARAGKTRLEAVRGTWAVYQQFRNAAPKEQQSGTWKYENAMGDVEVQLKKLLEEKQNGKN